MINPFQKLGDLKHMRDQAMAIQKALQSEKITVDKNGVHLVITGDQKVLEFAANGKSDWIIMDAINEAVKKSQEVAAKKLQEMGGGLGL